MPLFGVLRHKGLISPVDPGLDNSVDQMGLVRTPPGTLTLVKLRCRLAG